MPITLITGPANAGKAGVVMDASCPPRARERPLLVVPTTPTWSAIGWSSPTRACRRGSGAGTRVERFQGLLAEVLRRAGSAERPLGRLARERALAAVLHKAGEERAITGGRPRAGERITPQAPPTAGVVRSLGRWWRSWRWSG